MARNDEIVELLNDILTNELTSVNQYFVDAKMLQHWGYDKLGDHFHHESIEEMKDADELIERILYLDGIPNMQRLNSVHVGETPLEKLQLAEKLERESIDRLNASITQCASLGDNGTRDLLAEVLKGEEEHLDWLGTQLELIAKLGDAHYLSQQLGD